MVWPDLLQRLQELLRLGNVALLQRELSLKQPALRLRRKLLLQHLDLRCRFVELALCEQDHGWSNRCWQQLRV